MTEYEKKALELWVKEWEGRILPGEALNALRDMIRMAEDAPETRYLRVLGVEGLRIAPGSSLFWIDLKERMQLCFSPFSMDRNRKNWSHDRDLPFLLDPLSAGDNRNEWYVAACEQLTLYAFYTTDMAEANHQRDRWLEVVTRLRALRTGEVVQETRE